VANRDVAILVPLGRQHHRRAEGLSGSQGVSHIVDADVEDGVAFEADAACGWRRVVARWDERVLGRLGSPIGDWGSGGGVPSEQARLELSQACGVRADQFEVIGMTVHLHIARSICVWLKSTVGRTYRLAGAVCGIIGRTARRQMTDSGAVPRDHAGLSSLLRRGCMTFSEISGCPVRGSQRSKWVAARDSST
jgi:hypothetical protein